jgi:hypothetical protein
MKELTKGDIVNFEGQLSVVEDYSKGKTILLIFIISSKTSLVVRVDEVAKATRVQVESKITEMGWREIEPMGYSKGDWLVEYIATTYCTNIPILCEDDFDTAPTQQAEAILVAQLLNATKD